MALEREDLVVVHAAWDDECLDFYMLLCNPAILHSISSKIFFCLPFLVVLVCVCVSHSVTKSQTKLPNIKKQAGGQ